MTIEAILPVYFYKSFIMVSVIIIACVFVIGYVVIAFEHKLSLDKAVPAIFAGTIMWTMLAIGFSAGLFQIADHHGEVFSNQSPEASEIFSSVLLHHFGKIAEIFVFLIGAMVIVELIDLHRGFEVFKRSIKTRNKQKLLLVITVLAFSLSAVIDNLTATIVMISILRKLIQDKNDRLWFVAMVIIAANAGGAWSPVGDVTTTMLWVAHKVTEWELFVNLFLPSVFCTLIPFLILGRKNIFKGEEPLLPEVNEKNGLLSSRRMLFLGLGMIVFVPIFKILTGLPPYIGMMFSLAVVWFVSEYIHPEPDFTKERKHLYSAHTAFSRIELASVMFFLGILMAVTCLETVVINGVGALRYTAELLNQAIPNQNMVFFLLGIVSSVIDNVPLVAATIGMYEFPTDHNAWHFIAYAAGTGGSMLIIGSAAGVVAMGMEKVTFLWYLKNVTWIAFAGYIAGAIVYVL